MQQLGLSTFGIPYTQELEEQIYESLAEALCAEADLLAASHFSTGILLPLGQKARFGESFQTRIFGPGRATPGEEIDAGNGG